MWPSPCDRNFAAGGVYHFQIRLYETRFLLTTHSSFSALDFKLGVKTNYPLTWMFFFCTLSTAFLTSYHLKIVCSCWVWKLSNHACPLNSVPSALYPSTFANLHSLWRIEFFMKDVAWWLATCARKPKVPGSNPAAGYVQRWALCSNHPANV